MKSFTLKFALLFLLGVGLASTAAAQKIGGVVKDSAGKPVVGDFCDAAVLHIAAEPRPPDYSEIHIFGPGSLHCLAEKRLG